MNWQQLWRRVVALLVFGYAAGVLAVWLSLQLLADRFWPATLLAFGPRWGFALPLIPLALAALTTRASRPLLSALAAASVVLLFGVLDFHVGLGRTSQGPPLRLLTHNVGFSHITPRALDELLTLEHVDVAALQECQIQGDELTRLGWRFINNYTGCLVSRYPVAVVDVRDPMDVWKLSGSGAIARYEIETPLGRLNLLNVQLETIRDGLESILGDKFRGIPAFNANRAEAGHEALLAREWSRRGAGDLIVVGDFNMPVESAIYRAHWGDLRNAFSVCGRGFGHTKLTSWFGIRIDHVLMDGHWRCADARVIASPYGGDHLPVVVDLVREN